MQRLYDANMRLIGYYVQDAAGRVRALDSDLPAHLRAPDGDLIGGVED